jgi:gamma-glutamylcyclotransferase (GGCT)/AIG2-like uncharacterized protein YtfP
MLFAVNGTLMRGLELNRNMHRAGATFECEATTAPVYRLWSIGDHYPAMIRVNEHGAGIAVEVWQVDPGGLVQILEQEPPGLTIGRLSLDNGSEVFGVLAEPYLVEGQVEITQHGGWRAYLKNRHTDEHTPEGPMP